MREDWMSRVCVRLNPKIILRDESQYQDAGLYVVRYSQKGWTWCVDEVAFQVLLSLSAPIPLSKVYTLYRRLCAHVDEKDREQDFHALMLKCLTEDIVLCDGDETVESPISRALPSHVISHFSYPSLYAPFSFPVHVSYALMGACNLRCRHCMASEYPRRQLMSLPQIESLLSQLDEGGAFSLKLTGGEPMLHPHFWEVLESATRKRFSVGLLTNATLINENNVGKLSTIAERQEEAFIVSTSLDGADAETHEWMRQRTGAFARAVRAMRLMGKAQIRFIVQCCLNRRNMGQLEAIAELVFGCEARTLYFLIPCSLGRATSGDLSPFTLSEVQRLGEEVVALKERGAG